MNRKSLRKGVTYISYDTCEDFVKGMSIDTDIEVTVDNWREDLKAHQVNTDAEVELSTGGLVIYSCSHGEFNYVIHHYLTYVDGKHGDLFDVFTEYDNSSLWVDTVVDGMLELVVK